MTTSKLKILAAIFLCLGAQMRAQAQDDPDYGVQFKLIGQLEECGLPKEDAAKAVAVFAKMNTLHRADASTKSVNSILTRRMALYEAAAGPLEQCADFLISAGNYVHTIAFMNARDAGNVSLIPYRLYASGKVTIVRAVYELLDPLSHVHRCVSDPEEARRLTEPYYQQAAQYMTTAIGRANAGEDYVDGMFRRIHPQATKDPSAKDCASKLFQAGARSYALTLLLDEEISDAKYAIVNRYIKGAKR